LAQSQETPSGTLTPQIQFHSVPSGSRTPAAHRTVRGLGLAAGTPVAVSLQTSLSSKTAYAGQSWSGVVTEPVYRNGREVIPAGSTVRGVVAVARPAERGSRATLQLALRSALVNGRSYSLRGSSEAVTAGSPRLRNVGAVAGGAAAGALLGKVIGHSGKATLIGALIGGGAGTAAVAASHGYQATSPRAGRFSSRPANDERDERPGGDPPGRSVFVRAAAVRRENCGCMRSAPLASQPGRPCRCLPASCARSGGPGKGKAHTAAARKEKIMHILWAIVIGFLIGLLAKAIMPGRDPGGFIVTVLLGIAGSLLASFLGRQLGWYPAGAPAGFLASVVGAIILLAIYRMVVGRRLPRSEPLSPQR
jgi:uncharacterized membrane protein YeaQ/YmgE (transglycosylase-associated protein family)